MQEAAHAQQQRMLVGFVLTAALPCLVVVQMVGELHIGDSPRVAIMALPCSVKEERQKLQIERRTALCAERFSQRFDLVVAEIERTDVVRRHAYHHPLIGCYRNAFYDHVTHRNR